MNHLDEETTNILAESQSGIDNDYIYNTLGLFTHEILNMNQIMDADLAEYVLAALISAAIFKGMNF